MLKIHLYYFFFFLSMDSKTIFKKESCHHICPDLRIIIIVKRTYRENLYILNMKKRGKYLLILKNH